MRKLATAFLFLLFAVSINFAQNITITPKKTVYTRKGKDVSTGKRTFAVTYPVVSGVMPLATKKKLENTINYWRIFETSLQESLEETWLEEMSYEVNYNKNGFLDITLNMDGSGAYPDRSTKNIVIDLKSGEQVKFADVFKTDSLDKFAPMVDAKLKSENADTIKSIEEDKSGGYTKEDNDSFKEQLNALNFTAETFDEFSISDKGITILYDAGFPHAIEALQPTGRYFFTWAEVKAFIKPDGLLAKFNR